MSSDKVCTMMIMRWCNVQTNEYGLQVKTYPTICTHHKLHNTDENKFPVFPESRGYFLSPYIYAAKSFLGGVYNVSPQGVIRGVGNICLSRSASAKFNSWGRNCNGITELVLYGYWLYDFANRAYQQWSTMAIIYVMYLKYHSLKYKWELHIQITCTPPGQ